MKFDPNAATARYIDSLGPAALQKAHDYTVGKEWLLLWDLVIAAVVTWLIVRSGILGRLEMRIAERRRNLRAFVISLVYFTVAALLTLPWAIYESWWREKGYGRIVFTASGQGCGCMAPLSSDQPSVRCHRTAAAGAGTGRAL